MKKKLFSLFLAICMMISLLPVTAVVASATTSAEYDALQPGDGEFMVEIIISYNGDYDRANPLGYVSVGDDNILNYTSDDVKRTMIYDDVPNCRKIKYVFDAPANYDYTVDQAIFKFTPSAGCKIKGYAQGSAVYGTVHNLPSPQFTGQYGTHYGINELYIEPDGQRLDYISINSLGGTYKTERLCVSFEEADPGDIPAKPQNLTWDGTTARWGEVTGADNYKVSLYEKYGTNVYLLITSDYITTNYYDFTTAFTDYLPTDKNYVFHVEAIKNKVRSELSEKSAEKAGLHTHSSTGNWQYDGEHHWKECDACHRYYEYGNHSPSTGACSTCSITPKTIKMFWLWFKPTLGGTPATTEILYCGWMDNVNVLDHQLNRNNMKWYKMAANQYSGPSADGSTTGWTEMEADEQFVTDFMYRVDVNYDKEAGVSYFKNEDTNYYVKDNNVKCDSTLFILNDVIRLSGYFSPISAPVTPPSRPSREPDPEPTYLPYITDGKEMTWEEVCEYLKTLNDGDEADIHLGGADVVPEKVMTVIADKELKVNFIYSYAKSWFVDGAKIDSPAETNFAVSAKTSPDTSELRGVVGTSFEVFGANFPVEQAISFKTEHAGKFANLYKIENDKPVFVAAVRIDADGKAKFADMSAEGEYVVMLGEYSDLPGDMDNDGMANAKDALAILKHAAGVENGENPQAADVNGDGTPNAKDALLILKKAAGVE